MRELLAELERRAAAGEPVAYCRVVETRGSTPQKAGAAMLAFADGSQTGTLGGGCIEAEVKRRAVGLLGDVTGDPSDGRGDFRGGPQVFRFNLDRDYGWDDGLICGGRMQILVVPLAGARAAPYFRQLAALVDAGQGCTEVVVFDAEKSGLAAPACHLFDAGERLVASFPEAAGQAVGPEIQALLEPLAQRPRPKAEKGIAVLPHLPRCRLVIVGAGHVGQAVAQWAAELEFDVWIVDDRADYASRARFPRAARLIVGDIGRVLPELEITPDTYCLIVTRGHNHDEEALFHLAERGARYVGLIGSRRKIKLIFDDLEEQGVSRAALAQVYAPLGIDIGSQTVPEIAISILAELVSHRNRQGFVPGRKDPLLEPAGTEHED